MMLILLPTPTAHRRMVKLLTLKECFLEGNPSHFYSFDSLFRQFFFKKRVKINKLKKEKEEEKEKKKKRRKHQKERKKKMMGTTVCTAQIQPMACPSRKNKTFGIQ